MFCRQFDGLAVSPISRQPGDEAVQPVGGDAEHDDLLVRREPGAGRAVLLDQVGQTGQRAAGDPPDERGDADVELAVLLLVDPDVVPVVLGRLGGGVVDEGAVQVLGLEHLAELLDAPVGDQELQPGARAQPAVAVVAEDRGHALPGVGDLVERDPDAELLREHRVGGQAAADPQVEAGSVLGVDGADEGHVVGLGRHVLAGVAGERGLELARQVRERRVADVAALDLLQRRGAVDDLVGGDAGDGGAEERPRRVAAGLGRVQAGGVELLPDRGDVLDPDPVVLDVLPVGHVGGVTGVVRGDLAQRPDRGGREERTVGAHAHHEELVVELLLLEHRGLAAVEARGTLRVEAHPAEPPAQVGRVDRGEAALGVDVQDPGPHVERVVVLLRLLVLVQRLGVAERPLALTALGTRTGSSLRGGGHRWLPVPCGRRARDVVVQGRQGQR